MLYPALITEALSTVRYPGAGKSLTELDMVADDIRIDGHKTSRTRGRGDYQHSSASRPGSRAQAAGTPRG